MILERPPIHNHGDTDKRLSALERYLYRLVQELETILEALEEGGQKDGSEL
ncbi:MAG: hypothetical protein IKT58_05710 [Oscillospiraceae bacterium]|nr:hypothetical protein [Oscillospiraceae bacterium]